MADPAPDAPPTASGDDVPVRPAATVMLLRDTTDGPEVFMLFFSSRRLHTSFDCDWSSDVCSSDLARLARLGHGTSRLHRAADRSTGARRASRGRIRPRPAVPTRLRLLRRADRGR